MYWPRITTSFFLKEIGEWISILLEKSTIGGILCASRFMDKS